MRTADGGPGAARDHYDELVTGYLGRPRVSLGRSLSNEVLMVDGRIFAFRKDDRLVVKLPADRVAGLVDDGAEPFRSGGRVLREWVMVPLQPGGR